MTEPLTSAERSRRYRRRQADGSVKPAVPCHQCGRPVQLSQVDPLSPRGLSQWGRLLCARCWVATPEGKAIRSAQRREQRRKAKEQSEQESQP